MINCISEECAIVLQLNLYRYSSRTHKKLEWRERNGAYDIRISITAMEVQLLTPDQQVLISHRRSSSSEQKLKAFFDQT